MLQQNPNTSSFASLYCGIILLSFLHRKLLGWDCYDHFWVPYNWHNSRQPKGTLLWCQSSLGHFSKLFCIYLPMKKSMLGRDKWLSKKKILNLNNYNIHSGWLPHYEECGPTGLIRYSPHPFYSSIHLASTQCIRYSDPGLGVVQTPINPSLLPILQTFLHYFDCTLDIKGLPQKNLFKGSG